MKTLIVNFVAVCIIVLGSAYLVQEDARAELKQTESAQTETVVNNSECVYAEYRNQDGDCWGSTTRLCEGSSDCPTQIK
jgi:hypothetical protein